MSFERFGERSHEASWDDDTGSFSIPGNLQTQSLAELASAGTGDSTPEQTGEEKGEASDPPVAIENQDTESGDPESGLPEAEKLSDVEDLSQPRSNESTQYNPGNHTAAGVTTVADLRSQLTQEAAGIITPTLGDFSPAQAAIRRRGFELANARLSQTKNRAEEIKRGPSGATRAANAINVAYEPPPELDPVPEATAVLVEKSNRRLSTIIPPPVLSSPLGHQPVVSGAQRALTAEDFQIILSHPPGSVPEGLDAEQREAFALESERIESLRNSLVPAVLEDDFTDLESVAPIAIVAPEHSREITDLGSEAFAGSLASSLGETRRAEMEELFGRLVANSDQEAQAIIAAARSNTVIDGVPVGRAVSVVYEDIGWTEFGGEVQTQFEREIAMLASEIGMAESDLESRIEEQRRSLSEQRDFNMESVSDSLDESAREIIHGAGRMEGVTQSVVSDARIVAGRTREAAENLHVGDSVPETRDRLLENVNSVVAEQQAQYRQQGEVRTAMLLQEKRAYADAYRLTAQRDIYLLNERTRTSGQDGVSRERIRVIQQTRQSEIWRDAEIQSLESAFGDLLRESEAEVALYQEEVRDAGTAKREALREWADTQMGVARTAKERAQQLALDEAAQIERDAEVWASVEHQRTIAAISRDFDLLKLIEADVQAGLDRDAIVANQSLTAAETALMDAYLSSGADDKTVRALDAVSISTRMRVAQEQQLEVAPRIAELVSDKPESDWVDLRSIAIAQGGNFNALEVAGALFKAIDGFATTEEVIFTQLANRTPLQLKVLKGCYFQLYRRTLDSDLEGDLSGRELQRARALMESSQDKADAIALRQAMHGNAEGRWYNIGGITGWGTDRDTIHSIMRNRDPAQAAALEAAYREISPDGSALVADIHSELKREADRDRFDAEFAGNFNLADAIELRQLVQSPANIRYRAERGHPVALDRDKIEAVYSRIRTEVQAQADRERWTSDRLEGEIERRNSQVEELFNARYNDEFENPSEGALRSAFSLGFQWRESDRNLIEGLADNDMTRVDAARIQIENRGIYADDDVQNGVLEAQYNRALATTRRDQLPLRRIIMARQLALREARDPEGPWLGSKRFSETQRLERQIDRTLENSARSQASGNMNALRDAYERDYGGSLDRVILANTQGYDHDKARHLLENEGYLTPAQQVYYSIRGAGTDEAALRTALTGRTASELTEMRQEFARLARTDSRFRSSLSRATATLSGADFGDMDQEIANDLSGRTAFDIGQLLKGDPETVEEQRERLLEALNYELDTGLVGNTVMSGERAVLQLMIDDLDRTIVALNDPTVSLEHQEHYIGAFKDNVRSVNAAIANHRQSLDSIVDKVTMAIAVGLAVVVGAVISVFTLGMGGAVIAALIGSLLATAGTIATRQLILSGQYGWEDLGTDAAIGVVDALFALATAGLAGKILGAGRAGLQGSTQLATRNAELLAKGGMRASAARFMTQGSGKMITASEGQLTRLVPSNAYLSQMVDRGGVAKVMATTLAESGENLVQGTGSALATTILSEKTWEEGNPLANLVSGTLQQAAMSVATGLAAKPVQGSLAGMRKLGVAGRDVWLEAANPTELLPRLQWQEFKRMYPEATHSDYMFARARQGLPIIGIGVTDHDLAMQAHGVGHHSGMGATTGSGRVTELRNVLPENIRKSVPVILDSGLSGRTVQVQYSRSLGGLTDIRIVAGPDATAIDIILHLPTVQAMRQYTGLSGRAVTLIEHLQFWVNKRGKPPVGSAAWEAHLELNKLPDMINDRIRTLAPMDMDAGERMNILRDIQQLSRQIDRHQDLLDAMDITPGVGYVAAQDYRPATLKSRPDRIRSAGEQIRYRASDSPLAKAYSRDTVFQVGANWDEGSRMYRLVEVVGTDGKIIRMREEIFKVDGSGRWVQRGSESNKAGHLAEGAARLQTQSEVDASGGSLILLPASFNQSASGAGFDQVAIRFDTDGNATIVITEVKNYGDRYVPLADFTAINDNLEANLANLRRRLRDGTKADAWGLTPEQMSAAQLAARRSNIEIQILTAPRTKLGNFDKGTVLKTLAQGAKSKLRKAIKVQHRAIEDSYMRAAAASDELAQAGGYYPSFYQLAGVTPSNLTPERIRAAQVALTAQNAAPGLITPPLSTAGEASGKFQDSKGVHFFTHDIPHGITKGSSQNSGDGNGIAALDKVAADLVALIRSAATGPYNTPRTTRLLVNVTSLTPVQRARLMTSLETEARRFGDINILKNMVLVDVRLGTAIPIIVPDRKVRSGRGD